MSKPCAMLWEVGYSLYGTKQSPHLWIVAKSAADAERKAKKFLKRRR